MSEGKEPGGCTVTESCLEKTVSNDYYGIEAGQLELNAFEPVIAYSLFASIDMLVRGMKTLGNRCVRGITANRECCRHQVEESPGLITILDPELGYEACSEIAKESYRTGVSVYRLIVEKGLISEAELRSALSPELMTNQPAD